MTGRVPVEVDRRRDLRKVQCESCQGFGMVDRHPLDDTITERVQCFKCGGSGVLIERKCPECGGWTLTWGDMPTGCDSCGYSEEGSQQYKDAMASGE